MKIEFSLVLKNMTMTYVNNKYKTKDITEISESMKY